MYGYTEGHRDMTVADCAAEHCYKPMTEFGIYCKGHDYLEMTNAYWQR